MTTFVRVINYEISRSFVKQDKKTVNIQLAREREREREREMKESCATGVLTHSFMVTYQTKTES